MDVASTGLSDNSHENRRTVHNLQVSAAPMRWTGDRSPHHAIRGTTVAWTKTGVNGLQIATIDAGTFAVGTIPTGVFCTDLPDATFADPIISALADRFPGLVPSTDGSLFAGLITSITGQNVSLASMAVTQRRLCELFHDGVEWQDRRLHPLPTAEDLAESSPDLVRTAGMPMKRAEAMVMIAQEQIAGNLPTGLEPDAEEIEKALIALPGVGPWTSASALLWGVGHPDVFPMGDVALLRAARAAYDRPEMTMVDLRAISEGWRPFRSIAARLLWTDLLGLAW